MTMSTEEGIWGKIKSSEFFKDGEIETSEFIKICLYDEDFGYYRAARTRVGGEGADFYTSSSLKEKVFGRLLRAAADKFFTSSGENPLDYPFAEIGAEPGTQIIEGAKVFRLGDEIKIPEKCVLISNELLDAQPFSRFKFQGGKWRKAFIKTDENNCCEEIFKDASKAETKFLNEKFPQARLEGFRIDFSFPALEIFEKICTQNWRGVLIFADYFRTSQELCEMPRGTARTYKNHKYGGEIWNFPGETDITFSPCSDFFIDILKAHGFSDSSAKDQEKFFIENSAAEIEKIISNPSPFDMQKRELAQLISPAHMGASFRILSAARF